MTRLRPLRRDLLDAERAEVWDAIVQARSTGGTFGLVDADGSLTGPFNAMVHVPALGRHWSALGVRLRFDATIGQDLVELAICTVGAHFQADFEFLVHAPLAIGEGISPTVIDALRAGTRPEFERDADRIVYDVVDLLVRGAPVEQSLFDSAHEMVGETGIVELVSLVGYYSALAMILNLFDVAPPEGFGRIWPDRSAAGTAEPKPPL